MYQPEGYTNNPKLVCKMMKSIYGLKQSARAWWEDLNRTLEQIQLKKTHSDNALWIRHLLFILGHVDDILIIGMRHEVDETKAHIHQKYNFKDLGPVSRSKYIGMMITRDRPRRRLYIDQAPYVHDILDEFLMTNCTSVSIPMDCKEKWELTQEDVMLNSKEIRVYQRAIGRLMYLMVGTRPDIAYAVTKLAQFSATPSMRHWLDIIRIMRYLRSHDSVRLTLGSLTPDLQPFPCNRIVPTSLVGYFDASLMDCATSRRSTGAYVFFLDGALISWSSKRQGLVALSSTEAEFIAGTEAARELAWLMHFLEGIGMPEKTPILYGDNKSALALAKQNAYRPRTKHIHVRERYIAHMVESGQCLIDYVPTKHMIADALTKPLPREPLERHTHNMGLLFLASTFHQCHKCFGVFPSRNQLHPHIHLHGHHVDDAFPTPNTFC